MKSLTFWGYLAYLPGIHIWAMNVLRRENYNAAQEIKRLHGMIGCRDEIIQSYRNGTRQ
jgi:hypothetical protein